MSNAWASPESDDDNPYGGLYEDYNPNPKTIMQYLFSFDGRIGRATYWVAAIGGGFGVALALMIPIIGIGVMLQSAELMNVLVLFAYIPLLWLNYAVTAKRWHDRGKSGWWSLIGLVPIIGGLWMLVECGFMEGDAGDNEYGPPPM